MKTRKVLLALCLTMFTMSYAQNSGGTPVQNQPVEKPSVFKESTLSSKDVSDLYASVLKDVRYPKDAMEGNVQGTVILAFIVDEKGRGKNVIVEKSLSPSCDEAAVIALKKAFKKYRFAPQMKDKKPVPYKMKMPIKFLLN